jgi:menaquinone-dependent protoporphyrinogen oxidase
MIGAGLVAGAAAVVGGGWTIVNWAPETELGELPSETIGDGMSTVLVVYATKTGCTAGIATAIAEALAAAGATVDVRPVEDKPDPSGYAAAVIGSGVRVGSWHGSIKQWVNANAETLKARPVAFFTACLTMATDPEKTDEVRAYTDPLIAESGVTPVAVGLFAGMNEPKRFSLPERLIMKAMKAPEGDFRDLDAVAAWAHEIAPDLGLAG